MTYDPLWQYTKSLLHLDGVNGSTKMVDERHTVFTSSGLSVSDQRKLFGRNTLKSFGNGSNNVYGETILSPGTLDFCFEFWVNPEETVPGQNPIPFVVNTPAANAIWLQLREASNPTKATLVVYPSTGAAFGLLATSDIPLNTWTHIAIVRQAYTWKLYINGVLEASAYDTREVNFSYVHLGGSQFGGHGYLGYMADYRFTYAHPRYTANFTPPTEPHPHGEFYDADYDKVVLHCHFNGENGSNTFVDQKGHTISNNGAITHTTGNSKFGGSAMAIPTAIGNYLALSSQDFNFESGDFTIEGWALPGSGITRILTMMAADGTTVALAYGSPSNGFLGSFTVMGVTENVPGVASGWAHFAIVRDGATLRIYYRGGQILTNTNAANLNFNGLLYVGPKNATSPAGGLLDELRITKGFCRYKNGAPFTTPVEPFPDFTVQKLSGTVRDPSGTPISRTVRSYRASDGLYVDTAVSDPTTGAFELRATDVSEHFVVVHDPAKNALIYDHIVPVV